MRERATLDPEVRERRRAEPPLAHPLLALQRSAGNQAVVRHLARLQAPPGEETLERAILVASIPELKTVLEDLETPRAAFTDEVTVRLPMKSVSIRGEDVTKLRFKVMDKLRLASIFMLATGRAALFTAMRGAATDEDRRARTLELRAFDAPFLTDIRRYATSPATRFHHDDPTVQDGVLAAIQLEAIASAEGRLASPKDAHEVAWKAAGMAANFDWCGFFAMENYMQSNLDADLKRGFFHVTNIEHYFTYHYAFGKRDDTRVMKWIHADDEWHDLREYHTTRGSLRTWIDAAQIFAGGTLDIRPGDLVLIDHSDTGAADHIVMAHSFDMTTNMLFTIGGNDGGYMVDTGAKHAPGDEKRTRLEGTTGQPLRSRGSGTGVGVGSYDLDDSPDPVTLKGGKRVRIYGIGRPSIVDFEEHRYDSTSPKHPPNAA